LEFGKDLLIYSPKHSTSFGYFANHSCEPNAIFLGVIINKLPRMILKLIRDIKKDEEITVDYCWNSNNGKQLNICRCSFPNCLLFIEEDKRKLFDKTLKKFKKSPKQIVKIIINL
jgi:SET domain-containing protein